MGNNQVDYTNDFTVTDGRVSPFTKIPRVGALAISRGQLSPNEISVYVLMNMMLDGVIRYKDPGIEKAIAHCTGLTVRQVNNIYKKLHEKGLLHLTDDNVMVNW